MTSGRRSRARDLEARLRALGPELQRVAETYWRSVPMHMQDQHDAARREGRAVLEGIRSLTGWTLLEGRSGDALHALLVAALALRVRTFCPHARRGPVLGDLTWVCLSSGWIACRRCLPAFAAADPRVDDRRCDLCDEPVPNGPFVEHLLQVGSVIWHFNRGDCCAARLAAALRGEAADGGSP